MFLSSWLRTSFVLLSKKQEKHGQERGASLRTYLYVQKSMDRKEERSSEHTFMSKKHGQERGNMRIMGLDFGSKTVGVAVSDLLGITAQGVETITREEENKLRRTCARIEELIQDYEIETIVLGYPKNMNNTAGDRAKKTEEFKDMLERRTGLPVVLWDERLTTAASERILMESGVRRENRKAVIDKVAAGLILQGYLDSLKRETGNEQ